VGNHRANQELDRTGEGGVPPRVGDNATKHGALSDALIAFMAATSQAQAEATKATQRAGIEHANQSGDRAYLGRKPSFTREQFVKVHDMLGQEAVTIAQIARNIGLSRQTIYRIKGDPAGAEAALAAWNYNALSTKLRATLG
jgi:putative DNA-invertase from lambdoid prophage Rac